MSAFRDLYCSILRQRQLPNQPGLFHLQVVALILTSFVVSDFVVGDFVVGDFAVSVVLKRKYIFTKIVSLIN